MAADAQEPLLVHKVASRHADRDPLRGAVVATDGNFPYRSPLPLLAQAGVAWLVLPGNARNDRELVDEAGRLGIGIMYTRERAFRH